MPENSSRYPDHFGEGLFTDLYELTMAQAYDAEAMDKLAVFELYFRTLPENRNYVVAAGLADVLDYVEHLHFSDDDLSYLRRADLFSDAFLNRLRRIRFTGDVYAVPEGTVVFANEPVVQVVAPIIEGQLIETLVLNQIHFQSVIATKAARTITAASGRYVVDFGSRRAHGIDAALKVARVSYLVGAVGTSNVLAGKMYDIPIYGTMAHSYIQAHDREAQAFEAFARLYPQTTLLVDTYDTLEGVQQVVRLARTLGDRFKVQAIRLDSGDLGQLALVSRKVLDDAGLHPVTIFASGGLDEYEVARLVKLGAPIDGFGVGTKMAVSRDAPDLDFAYKLVDYAGKPRTKRSPGKVIHPGRKQVFRQFRDGKPMGDIIALHDEVLDGQPLLRPVMRGGARLREADVSLSAAREYAMAELARLPQALLSLERCDQPYPVRLSDALARQADSSPTPH